MIKTYLNRWLNNCLILLKHNTQDPDKNTLQEAHLLLAYIYLKMRAFQFALYHGQAALQVFPGVSNHQTSVCVNVFFCICLFV